MAEERIKILESHEIEQKIRRIAFQLYEIHAAEDQFILAGIADNGYIFAEKLKHYLDQIPIDKKVELCKVKVDKKNPLAPVHTELSEKDYKGGNIVLVDDVLNSGSTLIYGVKHFLEVELKQLHTAVLVDRSHKRFPVKADFKGLSLSTSLNEHVEIVFEQDDQYAVLS